VGGGASVGRPAANEVEGGAHYRDLKRKKENPMVTFEPIVETDLDALTAVMTRAFDDDSQKHLGKERGGPPGYDNGDFFRQWLFGYEESIGYKIIADGAIIGALIVWIHPDHENFLGTVFVDPAYQDRGVGTQAWQFIEATYLDTRSWTLETPAWATKNHYFYEEKCGFRKLKTKEDLIVYRKTMV
jgi:ribosomal protein S18 acetylase RimI-like enzyme